MANSWRHREVLVLVEPDGATKTHQWKFKYGHLAVGIVLVVLSALVFWVGVVVFTLTVRDARTASRLMIENDSLRTEFGRLQVVEAELDRLHAENERVLRLAGVAPETLLTLSDAWDGASGKRPWAFSRPTTPPRIGILSRGYRGEEMDAAHPGVDIPGPVGAPIVAAGGGIVREVSEDSVYGNLIRIDHGDEIETLYGHNRAVLVQIGDSVSAGDPIAKLGNTGRSSAPHLHFEVRIGGVPVDPGLYIREYAANGP